MFKQFIILTFILLSLTITVLGQNNKSKDTLLTMLTYGAIDATRTHAVNVAARKFGFKYYIVSGYCSPLISADGKDLTPEINIDSIKRNNNSVSKIIANKYGQDWRTKMSKEVDRLLDNEQKVRDFILSDTTFTNVHEDFADDVEDGLLRFIIDETPEANQYFVRVTKQIKKGNKYPEMIIYKLSVDMQKRRLKVLSDKVEPLYNRS